MALQIKGSHVPGVVPAANELEERELAVNTKDGKLFSKTPDGTIIEIGADNINTGLETPSPDSGTHGGHRYINTVDSSDFLPLGTDATDLTYSSGSNPGVASIGANGVGSFTAGIDATATGQNAFAIGKNSNVSGDDSFSIGPNNISKNLSFSIGNNSTILGSVGTIGSFSIGSNNSISGDGSVAIGYNNNIPYNESIVIGSNNESLLNRSYALGYSLKTSNLEGNVVLGKYNNNVPNKSLIIGAGTADTDRKNILELDYNTGVLSLPLLNSTGNIQNNFDVVTLGYLESYTNIVRTVNGYSGNVSLTAADINEQVGVDRLWMKQSERDQIVANTNAINTKEPLLPTPSSNGLILTVLDASSRVWEWKTLDASSVTLNFTDLLDTPSTIDATDANKYVKVNGAGTALIFDPLTRTELNIISDGSTTTDPVSGLKFELSADPYYWGINQSTYNFMINEYGDRSDLGPILGGDYTNNVNTPPVAVALDSLSIQVGDINNLNTTQKSEIVGAINEVNGKVDTNSTNIGDLTTLSTTDKSNLVNAINEVKGVTGTNSTNITNNTNSISTLQGYILGSGTTASRPSTSVVGAQYFDTDLTKPIWWDGTQWVDATGTAV